MPIDTPTPCRDTVYGNPDDTTDPLNPSNKGLDPRVVGNDRSAIWFPLKPGGALLYYGTGEPMRPPHGEPVRAAGSVRLNYGMRLERSGRTYFMAWQTNHDSEDGPAKNATGWVAADDMTEDGATAANAAVPRRLGSVEVPVAQDAAGKAHTFAVDGSNERAAAAKDQEWKYEGVSGHHWDQVANFFNLHDGGAGLQVLVNLPDMHGGGIAADCFPNGTIFTAGAGEYGRLITRCVTVYDAQGDEHALTFIYGKAGDTWGWVVKDWLD